MEALAPSGPPACPSPPPDRGTWETKWEKPKEIDNLVKERLLPTGCPDATGTAMWLRSRRSVHTRRAYFRDLEHFLSWLSAAGLDPLRVTRPEVDSYLAALRANTLSPATINRRLATLSSWYSYLVDADVAPGNPVTAIGREPFDREFSPTIGPTQAEVRAVLRAADDVLTSRARRKTFSNAWLIAAAERDRLLVGLLAHLGLRVGEVIALRWEDLHHDAAGMRAVVIHGKGDRHRQLPLPPALLCLLDPFLTERRRAAARIRAGQHYADKQREETAKFQQQGHSAADAKHRAARMVTPLRGDAFARIAAASPDDLARVRVTGLLLYTKENKPLTQAAVFATVRRLARAAGLPAAEKISPHSLRHAAATAALDDGALLRDVQDFLGHADPRTTRRYARNRGSLDPCLLPRDDDPR